jgi:hypothetical protein
MAELVFKHVDDVPYQMVKSQTLPDGRHAGVHCKIVEWRPNVVFIYTRYDPGLVLEEHGHNSDHIIYVLDGTVTISGQPCRKGSMVLLEHGATFGPIEVGPDGTELLEFYSGDPRPRSVDAEAFAALLAGRGIAPDPDPSFTIPS